MVRLFVATLVWQPASSGMPRYVLPVTMLHHDSRSHRRAWFMRRFALNSILCALLGLHAGLSVAQEFPSKPIRLVVASSPGSSSDLAARIVAPEMSKALGQPVIVENKPGAGQIIGLEYVARQVPADGYTLAVPTVKTLVLLPLLTKETRFDILKPGAVSGCPHFCRAEAPAVAGDKLFAEFASWHAQGDTGQDSCRCVTLAAAAGSQGGAGQYPAGAGR